MIINGEALEHLEHVDGLVHVVESAGLASPHLALEWDAANSRFKSLSSDSSLSAFCTIAWHLAF